MCRDELFNCPPKPLGIDCATVEFDVQVRGNATELLILRTANPVGVLHGGQREGLILRRALRVGGRDVVANLRGRCHALSQQRMPGLDRRLGSELRKGDATAALTPSTGQCHHANRVQPERDEVINVRDLLGGNPDEVRDGRLDLVLAD